MCKIGQMWLKTILNKLTGKSSIFAFMQIDKEQKSLWVAELAILAFVWLIIFSSSIIFQDDLDNIRWDQIFKNWQRLVPFLILTLFNHFILVPLFFFRKQKLWYFISAVCVLVVFVAAISVLREPPPRPERPNHGEFQRKPPPPDERAEGFRPDRRPPRDGRPLPPEQIPGGLPPNLNSILIAILILGFDTGLRTVFKWTKSEQEKEILEKEKVKSELAFLRNQVSPHFLMNTLNNIHALIDFDKDEAKESIIRLSKLMRHLLYDSEEEKISIKKEVEFIKNYIELMKLRFTDKVKVKLELPDVLPDQIIPPLLFTSFIENAFKHGVSYNAESFINVSLSFTDTNMKFEMQNSNFSGGISSRASGIGLDNIKKRLNLLYQENYKLEIFDQSDVFVINLSIPI